MTEGVRVLQPTEFTAPLDPTTNELEVVRMLIAQGAGK
jgi:hypothetical protein